MLQQEQQQAMDERMFLFAPWLLGVHSAHTPVFDTNGLLF